MYESFDGSENVTLPMVLALHDKYRYQYHITRLAAGSLHTIYIRAVQEFDDLRSYSSWVTMNKTTSKLYLFVIIIKLFSRHCHDKKHFVLT
jgi:hypothetical protein